MPYSSYLGPTTRRERALAAFYAELASVPAPADPRRLAPLLPGFQRILALSPYSAPRKRQTRPKAATVAVLAQVQADVSEVLRALLAGKSAPAPAALTVVPASWRLTNGRVSEVWEPTSEVSVETRLIIRALAPLAELVKTRRFPFALCPFCDRVFVWVTAQKYCSPECAYRGTVAVRNDQRREYMRVYMKRRRAEERRARRKET